MSSEGILHYATADGSQMGLGSTEILVRSVGDWFDVERVGEP